MKKLIIVLMLCLLFGGCSSDIKVSKNDFMSYDTVTELTKDNFFDYFEVIEKTNPDNDPETIDYYLVHKDVPNEINNGLVNVKFELHFTYVNGTFDMNTNETLVGYAYSDGTRHVEFDYQYRFDHAEKLILSSEYETPYKDNYRDVQLRRINTFDYLEIKEIEGKIETVNIPEDVFNTDKEGNRYIVIDMEDKGKYYVYENGDVDKDGDYIHGTMGYQNLLLEQIID